MKKRLTVLAVFLLILLFFNGAAFAAEQAEPKGEQPAKQDKATEISKQAQDPLSGLILMPVQYNYNFDIGPQDKSSQELLIEPTFPIKLTEKWQILTHTIIPVVSMPEVEGNKSSSGLSNIAFSALISPKTTGKFTWGVGGGILLPTASDTSPISWTNTPTGYDCWAAGPSVVGVYKNGPWVAGALFNQMWSFSGDSEMNAMQIQGFAFYNIGQGFSIGYMPLVTIDWRKASDESTLLPVGLQVGKLFMIKGVFPIGVSLGSYYNVVRPDYAPKNCIRAQLFFVLPESIPK
jgi:hypothetical protein